MTPSVSVIIPTYNRPKLLERTLKSVEAQTFTDYEIIVVNDAGTDVNGIVGNFEKAVYLEHSINRGLSAARNTGIRQAKGKYITFLDDDDVIFPEHLQTLVKEMNKGTKLAYTDAYWWVDEKEYKKVLSNDFDRAELLKHNLFPVMCAMVERSLFDNCMFDEELPSHEDYELWLRMSDKTNFVHIPVFTAAYSQRGGEDQISNKDIHKNYAQIVRDRYIHKMETQPKRILLFMPTYEKDGIIQAWMDAVDSFYALEAPKDTVIDRVIGLDNPYGVEARHKNTLHQYQVIRKKVLDEGYDALVTFEHDMIVPVDGLIKLWEVPAQVVYGLYMLRHNAYCINAFLHIEGSPNPHKSITYLPKAYKEAERRGWARVTGVGMGFTLFRRKVLEAFPFRASGNSYPPDWAISVDCTKHNIKQICRFDVKCGHIEPDGIAIYPRREGDTSMTKVKILKQFVGGDLYLPGQIVDIDSSKVNDFFRAGYLQILQEPDAPAIKILNKPDKKSTKTIKDKLNKAQVK